MADSQLQRDPDEWKTGNDPMTEAQRVYAETLTTQLGEPSLPDNLTKAQAAEKIEDLRTRSGLDTESNDIDPDDDPNLGKDDE